MELPSITIRQLRSFDLTSAFGFRDKLLVTDQVEAIERFRQPCRLSAITVLVCINGEAECVVNLNRYHVERDMVMVCFPDDIIQVSTASHLEAYAVLMSLPLLNELGLDMSRRSDFYLRIRQNAACRLPQQQVASLKPYYTLLHDSIMLDAEETPEVIRSLLRACSYSLIGMMRQGQPQPQDAVPDTPTRHDRGKRLFNEFMALVKRHHTTHRGVKFYASKLCLTPNYLSGLVKEYTGKTATEWVNDFVILEAKVMLKDSSLSIQEIAYRLNFPSQSAFGKYFKKLVGVAPKLYRNEA